MSSRDAEPPEPAGAPTGLLRAIIGWFRERPLTLGLFFPVALLVSVLLYVRSPWTNYIFDEQEALLANPYVTGHGMRFLDAFHRDFWGLPPDRTIGSYRPLPNLIWRCIWPVNTHPWVIHLVNLVIHAVNAALIARIAARWTGSRQLAWISGAVFVTSAVITEAVSGVVGLADVLAGLGLLLAVTALEASLVYMPPLVFAASLFALFSKETSIVVAAVVPWAALISAPLLHAKGPLRGLRALLAFAASLAALVLYVRLRKQLFPTPLPDDLAKPLLASSPWIARVFHQFLAWFQQPRLPQDPINNPLIGVPVAERAATGLRIYSSGIGRIVFPWTLSGDYSFSAELPEARLVSPRSVLGVTCLIGPILLGFLIWIASLGHEPFATSEADRARAESVKTRLLSALGLMWVPICYFPCSNIPILLPTIRADRFWYLPVMGSSWFLACVLHRLLTSRWQRPGAGLLAAFLGFQAVRARVHALAFDSDLEFWRSATLAVPRSAKAHLNYGVMLGARRDYAGRLRETHLALDLAPSWAMAHVYYADALCRGHRDEEAWPYYRRGFELAPNDPNLIALGLQCLWDNRTLKPHQDELSALASSFPGSWLAYLGHGIIDHGTENDGIEKKYRPRGYDESVHTD